MSIDSNNRAELVIFWDAKLSNPNGDADTGLPRQNPYTQHGLVTDACIKRKIRNYLGECYDGQPGRSIYYGMGVDLVKNREAVYTQLPKLKDKQEQLEAAKAAMLQEYIDIRLFGAVMSTNQFNSGAVRGAVQVDISESISPVDIVELSLTRKSVDGKDGQAQVDKNGVITGTFGQKYVINYGLFKTVVRYNPAQGQKNGVSQKDLDLLVEAIQNMFIGDAAASRTNLEVRKVFLIQHDSTLGNGNLVESVQAKAQVEKPQKFSDYEIVVPDNARISEV